MKKNISINISGIIFHIEEDGYERLKNYLESINQYFSTYEDSKEITEDIEGRIAEIFLSKLRDGQQVVTSEDVDHLISTMGSVKDFEAIEEEEDTAAAKSEAKKKNKEKAKTETSGGKKLYRDQKRRLLGGVAAGIANYFGIDPLWVRLMLFILALNLFFDIFFVGGTVIIAYIICWIIIPESETLDDDEQVKKMYRDADDKVLGGVASGLAKYFGTDITLIRILFLISIFFAGTGLLLYIILWIITPEAKSITEKMQMEGEPVTLSNIESSVKRSLNAEGEEEENLLVKILLFPFRLISTVFSGLSTALGPFMLFLVEAIRIFAGVVITIVGVSMIFALLAAAAVVFGITAGSGYVWTADFPIEMLSEIVSPIARIFAFLAAFIPALALTFLGLTIILKRKVVHASVGWAMFALWIISLVGGAFTIPSIVKNFVREGSYKETVSYDFGNKTAILDINEVGLDDYEGVKLTLRGHSDSTFKLVKTFESQGSTRQEAIQNAKMVSYSIDREDSILRFDSNVQFKEDAKFRGQELRMMLYIPYGQPFLMEDGLSNIIWNTIHMHGYRVYQMEDNTWMFFEKEGLKCVTCEEDEDHDDYDYDSDNDIHIDIGDLHIHDDGNGFSLNINDDFEFNRGSSYEDFDVGEFSEIEIGDSFEVFVSPGNKYSVEVSGREQDVDDVTVENYGETLEVDIDKPLKWFNSNKHKIQVRITAPNLEKVNFSGASKSKITGYRTGDLDIYLSGAARSLVDIRADEIEVDLSGASQIELQGSANNLYIDMGGASGLNSLDLRARYIEIETGGCIKSKSICN